jgi:L-iditol 2-dehydrogenase
VTAPATMRAALLRDFGALTVAEVPTPVPGPGEVLVRVRACGICGTDLKIVAGAYRGTWPPELPFIIGHEWSGEVAALGPGTQRSGLAVGDRVVAENHTGCGACPMCRAGRYNLCERVREPGFKLYGHTAPGALAEYAVRPAVALHKVPANVTDLAAALVNQGALTVHAARRARLGPGASVAVFGPGLLGLLMLQVARAAGATTVIMVGRGERLAVARELGSTGTVDYERDDPVAGVRAAAAAWTACSTARATRPWSASWSGRSGAAGPSRCSGWPAARSRNCPWTWSPSMSWTCSGYGRARTLTRP